MRKTERPAGRRFQLILIKPSHYDDQGYVVQWLRSAMPSNSLAAVFSLANGAAERKISRPGFPHRRRRHGRDQHARAPRTSPASIAETAVRIWSGLSACSPTNSPAPWTLPGRSARRRPSGDRRLPCLRLPGHVEGDPEPTSKPRRISAFRFTRARPRKVSTRSLLDASRGELRPLYDHMKQLPDIGNIASPPFLPLDFIKRTIGT